MVSAGELLNPASQKSIAVLIPENLPRRCRLNTGFRGHISEAAIEEDRHTFSKRRCAHGIVGSDAVEELAHSSIDEMDTAPPDPCTAVVGLD